MKSATMGSIALFACAFSAWGQSVAPISIAQVVAQKPMTRTIALDKKHHADLLTWQITDPLSPASGTTLIWLDVNDDYVRLVVDAEPRYEDLAKSARNDATVVAVVSGGMWSGRYDGSWRERKPDGLVVTSGIPKGDLKATTSGGVAVFCGDDVSIVPMRSFPPQTRKNTVVLPCVKPAPSALQTSVVLVSDGRPAALGEDTPSNRLALGSGRDHIVIAGAFNSVGHALTLRQFAEFVAAASQRQKIANFSALNLDGDCGAQLYLPPLGMRFGCGGINYTVNRIVMRRAL